MQLFVNHLPLTAAVVAGSLLIYTKCSRQGLIGSLALGAIAFFTKRLAQSHSLEILEKITDEQLTDRVIQKVQELVAPFYERMEMIKRGKARGAASLVPHGIWYQNAYASALKKSGKHSVYFEGKGVSAHALYERLRGEGYFTIPRGCKKYWTNVVDETSLCGESMAIIRMKEGVSPTEAYKSLATGCSFLSCHTVLSVAVALVVIDLLGKKAFDAIGHKYPYLTGERDKDLVSIVQRKIDLKVGEKPKGTFCYLYNANTYTLKHPHGDAGGIHLIYIGNAKFIGFGLNPEGVTLEEANSVLLEEYNKTPLTSEEILPDEAIIRYDERPFIAFKIQDGYANKEFITRVPLREVELLANGEKECPYGISKEKYASSIPGLLAQLADIEKGKALKNATITQKKFSKSFEKRFVVTPLAIGVERLREEVRRCALR